MKEYAKITKTRLLGTLAALATILCIGLPVAVAQQEPSRSRQPASGVRRDDNRSAQGQHRMDGPPRRKGVGRDRIGLRPPPGLWHRMNDEERQAVSEFLAEHLPKMYEQLENLRNRKPQAYQKRMSRVAPEARRLMELLETAPEMASLIIQERRLDLMIRQASNRYRRASGSDQRNRLRTQMRDYCAQAFDLRTNRRAIEIRELESRLNELQSRHRESLGLRDKIIDRNVRDHLGESGMVP